MGGADKAAMDVAGRTMLDRVLAAARPLCDPLVVVGPVRATSIPGVQFVQEPLPGGGPVPAVAAGMAVASRADPVMVLAADLPLLTTSDVGRLLDRLTGDPGVDAAAALDHRGLANPLLAYRRPALDHSSGAGCAAAALLPARVATVDLGPAATLNVNRPADLDRAVVLLRSPETGRSRGSSSFP
jgi:molybdopterin-guanine dinucleotide biosynthesis protein A